MIQRPQPYMQVHVCINYRNGESPSCGYSGSEEIVEALRKVTKDDVPQIVAHYYDA